MATATNPLALVNEAVAQLELFEGNQIDSIALAFGGQVLLSLGVDGDKKLAEAAALGQPLKLVVEVEIDTVQFRVARDNSREVTERRKKVKATVRSAKSA